MLSSTSDQQQAELNWCQAQGLQQHFRHLKRPLLAATSIRCSLVSSCKPSCEVRAEQHRKSLWQGMEMCWGQGEVLVGCQAAPILGSRSIPALISARALIVHGRHACCPPSWGSRARHPAASLANQLITSASWHMPNCLCSTAHYYCKVEGMIQNHSTPFTSERGC